jgi:hydroxyacylglutathione hydrolase
MNMFNWIAMKKLMKRNAIAYAAIFVLLLMGISLRQEAKSQDKADAKVSAASTLVTAFNPATEKYDRTTAGPITHPQIIAISFNTYFINEFGMDSQYVLVGPKRALVIDTGSGFYDMKETIEKLTKLPYDVVITHGHPDHAGGMHQFDAVWINTADVPMANALNEQGSKMYGEMLWNMPFGYKGIWGYTPGDAKWGEWDKHPVLHPLNNGKVFDLGGGRLVTTYCVPGHTPGSCALLDHKERILFTGDAANINLLAATMPLSTTLRSLLKIKSLQPEYDRIYSGHTTYAGMIDAFPQDPHVLDDLIANCRGILRGEIKGKSEPNFLSPGAKDIVSYYGSARIHYDPNNLWNPGEQHIVP